MADDNKQVAVKGETGVSVLAVPTREAMTVVREAIGPGESLSIDMLERAKIPTGGASAWDMGDSDPTKVLEGVLVLRHPTRVYWKARFADTGGGTPPDCHSMDNQVGTGDRGLPGDTETMLHECGSCPLADWGTAVDEKGNPTNGKACRQVTRIFLLTPGSLLPTLVQLPPSSYKSALTYTVRSAARGVPYYGVLTQVSLRKEQSGGGIAYSVADFKMVRPLTPEEFAAVQRYRDDILPFLNSLSVMDVEAAEATA